MVVTTIYGFSALRRLSNVIVPLLVLLIIYTARLTLRAAPAGGLLAAGSSSSSFGDAVSATVGGLAAGATIFPDLCRFSRTTRDAAIAAIFSFAIALPVILLLAMIPSVLTHQRDLILIMTSVGLGAPALALLIVKAWATNAGNLYSASLSAANLLSSHSQRWVVVGAGIVGTLMAVAGISQKFIPFLITLSVAIPPIAGIYIFDVLWLGAVARNTKESGNLHRIRYSAFACWGFGIAVALAARTGFITTTGISAIDAMLAAAASYFLVCKLSPPRCETPTPRLL
jgi:cytosine permease